MSTFVFLWHTTKPVEHKPARDMRATAPHLRGHIRIGRRGCYYMSVVNTVTGETVSSDNGCVGLARAFEHAEFYTAAARAAWTAGLRQSSLRVKKRRKS